MSEMFVTEIEKHRAYNRNKQKKHYNSNRYNQSRRNFFLRKAVEYGINSLNEEDRIKKAEQIYRKEIYEKDKHVHPEKLVERQNTFWLKKAKEYGFI